MRILLHLISKVDPATLAYRPAPSQRSLLELLQYLTVYLKACGHHELGTMNLWAGMDARPSKP